MKLAIDLTSLSDNFSGLERVALELTREIVKNAKDSEFILVIKNEIPEVLNVLKKTENVRFVRIKGRNKLIANQFTLPLTMRRIEADAYLFPAFPVPLLFNKKNTYGMIADLGCYDVPQTMKKKQVLFFKEGNKHTAKVCKKVITVSNFSKGRIEELLPAAKDKVMLVYDGINRPDPESYTPERILQVKEKYSLPEEYLLSLSTIEPRKNLKLLIEAYMEMGMKLPSLVLAGRRGWLMEDDIAMAVESGRIIFTGFVDDEDLPALYAGSQAFVFPSLYEGFGMPPLEAQACGVRKVLSSDAPALKEVLGDTAMYFKNNDKDSLKSALTRLSDYEGATKEDIDSNLSHFTWEKSAEILWNELNS